MTIVTHAGVFHTDELAAIAFILIANGIDQNNADIIRTRNSELIASLVGQSYIIDVGGVYNAHTLQFDHHQDPALPAAFGLVVKHHEHVFSNRTALSRFIDSTVSYIDNLDKNPQAVATSETLISLFDVVRSYQDEAAVEMGFHNALTFMIQFIKNRIREAEEFAVQAKALQTAMENRVLDQIIAVPIWVPFWKQSVGREGIKFGIFPHPAGFQVMSLDAQQFPISNKIEGHTYRHPSGFMATFTTIDAAIIAAKKSVQEL